MIRSLQNVLLCSLIAPMSSLRGFAKISLNIDTSQTSGSLVAIMNVIKNKNMIRYLILIILLFVGFQPVFSQAWTGTIKIELGFEEKVFEYVNDHCAELDLPDVYAHAIRTAEGITLVSGNAPDNYFMFGRDFNSLKRSCTPVLRSGDKWPVETFDHQEWITSVYSEDGVTIHALVHNEYHDPYSTRCKPGVTDPTNPCWYNFISYAKSSDGGRTFTQPASPNHIVAMLPYKWNPTSVLRGAPPPHGYMEPSNIVKHNGYFYCMMFGLVSNTDPTKRGTCIMRTNDLSSTGSWKIWNGQEFNIPLVNPYINPPGDSSAFLPAFVSYNTIADLHGNLTWNSYLNQFMLIGTGAFYVEGVLTCGFFLSRSVDLINWSQPQLIRKTILGWRPCNSQTPDQVARNIIQEAYPSLIDHDAPDISFTSVDSTAYLYFMQNMDNHTAGGWGLRRDLVRIPIKFIKEWNDPNPSALNLKSFPNPFNSSTTISWQSGISGHTTLEIYDIMGRKLKNMIDEFRLMGSYNMVLDGMDLPSGTYYCKLQVGQNSSTVKIILMK
jgi:hypothetical protein